MPETTEQQRWDAYCATERQRIEPVLTRLGYTLEAEQPHLGGERYLMYAVTTESGRKLILLGRCSTDGMRVVIKATTDPAGRRELEHEHTCRSALTELGFAYDVFRFPEELLFTRVDGVTLSIQRFLEQECPFLERSPEEQFQLVLRALKAQEGAHATTSRHWRQVRQTFGHRTAQDYPREYATFTAEIQKRRTDDMLGTLLKRAADQLTEHTENLERYGSFLTHTDFVPHNFRVQNDEIYLLDHSSIRFGNKYEGWARLINFMTLHNPPLAEALTEYVRTNRTPEESPTLTLMRLYRLGEILWYYTRAAERSEGDLRTLNEARIGFWTDVLATVLDEQPLEALVRERYIEQRDGLRSADEQRRQAGLH